MQKHIKVYIEYFWENPLCEVCNAPVVDVHHLQKRSTFGKKRKEEQDVLSNLIWLCRLDHMRAHLQVSPYLLQDELQRIHNKILWKN